MATFAAVVAFGFATATPAGAKVPLQAPEVAFVGTGPGTVTVTLHNPNDPGGCWADARVGNNPTYFPESYAAPGQTITSSIEGLAPGTTITARGACNENGEYAYSDWVTVAVPGTTPAGAGFGG
ncbi:hypothetical protein [Nocardia gipuzkoensis]